MCNSLLRTDEELLPIYNRNVDTIYRVCFMYMKNVFDTENMVQNTFLKLIENPINFENHEHEKAWLIRTASNLCKNSLKHWWKKTVDIDSLNGGTDEPAYEQSFYKDEILEMIMSLPAKYKTAIYLYYYEEYKTAEIASILSLNESTVRGHLCTGRKLLKLKIENEEVRSI